MCSRKRESERWHRLSERHEIAVKALNYIRFNSDAIYRPNLFRPIVDIVIYYKYTVHTALIGI